MLKDSLLTGTLLTEFSGNLLKESLPRGRLATECLLRENLLMVRLLRGSSGGLLRGLLRGVLLRRGLTGILSLVGGASDEKSFWKVRDRWIRISAEIPGALSAGAMEIHTP